MSDIHDIRARLREARHQPAPSAEGSGVGFWIITAGAVALGFSIVMLLPRVYTMQRTASLPSFQQVASQVDPPLNTAAQSAVSADTPAQRNAHYAGKNADEIGKLADAVCAQRSASQVLGGPMNPAAPRRTDGENAMLNFASGGEWPDVNDRLYCRLTEAPARYCSVGQRQKITADVINYFKGVEYLNTSLHLAAKIATTIGPDADRFSKSDAARLGNVTVDPRVIEGVEGLIRAGYLLKPQREDVGANVPRPIKERFARIVGNKANCPEPAWWQVWK